MKTQTGKKACILLGIWLILNTALLLLGYSVQKPVLEQQEFPFSVTYSYQGEIKTISDVYVAEYELDAQYIGDDAIGWYGYVKDRNRLESDFYRIGESEEKIFSIDLNLEPGYLMGDPQYADSVCQPSASVIYTDETVITDPAELKQLGFYLVNWEYPEPVENSFSFGGISLSGEATMYTSVISVLFLVITLVLIRKDPETRLGLLDKISVGINLVIAFAAFPFILAVSLLSEILADVTFGQQLLYLAPALTVLGLTASVILRRMGLKIISFWVQFTGPAVFVLTLISEEI